MTAGNNIWGNVSSIAQRVESDAIHVVREVNFLEPMITSFGEMTGANVRRGYKFDSVTVNQVSDADDLVSQTFTPSADQDLTPYEYAAQYFITDTRAESMLPENILNDAAVELGLGAADLVMSHICGDFASLTGGTVGAAGTAITFSYLAAAIAQARNVNNSASKPLVAVIHGYQAAVLQQTASVAGATARADAPGFTQDMTVRGIGAAYAFTFDGVPVYQVFQDPDGDVDFNGGVFPREALAVDWRRRIKIEPQRDASRRGLELNMSFLYAHGVWRPDRGISMVFDATAPTS